MDRAFWIGVLQLILMVLLSVVIIALLFPSAFAGKKEAVLSVAFLDVGQGDSIFIESPDGTQILIDGGPDSSVLRELGSVMGFFDRDIDLMIATHPDMDHIGGLIDVLERYEVRTILLTDNKSDTPVASAFQEMIHAEGAQLLYAHAGSVIDLGAGAGGSTTLTVLFPDRSVADLESNTSSIIARLSYGSVDFMLTGDAPKSIESYLVSLFGDSLESEVLKAGHHGSETSSESEFVAHVDPEFAVISAGKDNRYGHPHKAVIDVLKKQGAQIMSTAYAGTILFETDGTHLVSVVH